ncbi:MAG: class I SAM-dependent methyltransferase [Rubricoccaceae bacterium]
MPSSARWNRLRYSLYAPVYDPVVRRLNAGRQRSLELADLQPGERVLIPGCGTGLDFPHLPPGVEVVAGDVAPGMVRAAQATADHLDPKVGVSQLAMTVRTLDAHQLDLPDASFDVVLLHLLLAVVPDPESAIQEVARVLRPGGRVAVFDKFLPDGARPSLGRKLASAVARVVATDLNRQLGPLLDHAGLVLDHREPVLFGGLFHAALARKPIQNGEHVS